MSLTSWSADRWIGIAGVVVGTLAIFAAWVFYRLAVKDCLPRLLVYGETLIESDLIKAASGFGDLKLTYDGGPISSASTVDILLWNAGREPILSDRIRTPLALVFPSHNRVLSASIRAVSRPEIDFRCTPSQPIGNALPIEFDHLDHEDGAVLSLLVEGDYTASPKVVGTIIGAPRGFLRRNYVYTWTPWRKYSKSMMLLNYTFWSAAIFVLGVGLFMAGTLVNVTVRYGDGSALQIPRAWPMVVALAFMALMLRRLIRRLARASETIPPATLYEVFLPHQVAAFVKVVRSLDALPFAPWKARLPSKYRLKRAVLLSGAEMTAEKEDAATSQPS